jgi:hypothetical protein
MSLEGKIQHIKFVDFICFQSRQYEQDVGDCEAVLKEEGLAHAEVAAQLEVRRHIEISFANIEA